MSTEKHSAGHSASLAALSLAALGVVFGDIGTSPLYTLKECLHATGHAATQADLYGVLSLIFWSLTMVVTVKYLSFIMRADNKGEGGIFALLALVPDKMRRAGPGKISTAAMFAVIGAALLYGDGVITPAISVLSAVEGLAVADNRFQTMVVPISCVILVGLFLIQKQGTGSVGKLFGPVMVLWFGTLAALGAYHISHNPEILSAMLPHHAVGYFLQHGFGGMHILAAVVLAVTGGEALYADMGHFGIKPIRTVWLVVVMPALILNYFGQGAHALRDASTMENPFFSMVPAGWATYALVALSSLAAIIASQALISGAFSLTRQAMQLGFFPRLRVLHTAHDMEGQIYVPRINLLLAVGCILLVLVFRESTRLASAYGIAVTGTMAITSLMYYVVVRNTWGWSRVKAMAVVALFLSFDIPFLWANLGKFVDGGYVPILIGMVMLAVMIIWNRGRTLMAAADSARYPSVEAARKCVDARLVARVPGTAVFMSSNTSNLPPVLVHYVDRSRALQETVILLTAQVTTEPVVAEANRFTCTKLEDGFYRMVLRFGFMEMPKVMPVLTRAMAAEGIPFPAEDVTYFLGRENFLATRGGEMGRVTESIFAFLQKNSMAADRFFELPHRQVIEIGMQMDL